MAKITNILAREIYDSRGTPTVEVDLVLSDDSFGRAAVPSGASTGIYEAVELRDSGETRLFGNGVRVAIKNVSDIIFPSFKNKQLDQKQLDEQLIALDGTPNKSKLGANAILGVSLAFAKATALSRKQNLWEYFQSISYTAPKEFSLPMPMMNILNGGKHALGASDVQEYMILPIGAHSFSQALEMGVTIYLQLKKIFAADGFSTTVGDEGGFAPAFASNEKPFEKIVQAIEVAGYTLGKDIVLAIDVAASELYKNELYTLSAEKKQLNSSELVALYKSWIQKFPLVSIEDPFEQNAWEDYQLLMQKCGNTIQIVGDDLFATNVKRIKTGITKKAATAVLVKLNQIGTVTETINAVDLARKSGLRTIISHRSGETEDTSIADLAVGLSTGQIKTGAPARSERVAKYNQLLRIEEVLGNKAVYPQNFKFSPNS